MADEYRGIKAFTDIYTLPSKSLSVNDNNIVTNSLKIYPNPVNSILTIDNPNNGNSEAKVFDMTGKLIKNVSFNTNDKNISLNVSDLIKGNYIIKIGNSVTKIIKNAKVQESLRFPDFCPADASEIVKIAKSALWSTSALLKSKVLQALCI